jgi:hypothetical protein
MSKTTRQKTTLKPATRAKRVLTKAAVVNINLTHKEPLLSEAVFYGLRSDPALGGNGTVAVVALFTGPVNAFRAPAGDLRENKIGTRLTG